MERSQLLDAMSQLKLVSYAFARFPGQLTNEKVPRPVLPQHRPPGLGHDRHKAHRRPGHGDPDRLRIAASLVPCLTKGAAQDGGIRPISWPNRAIPPRDAQRRRLVCRGGQAAPWKAPPTAAPASRDEARPLAPRLRPRESGKRSWSDPARPWNFRHGWRPSWIRMTAPTTAHWDAGGAGAIPSINGACVSPSGGLETGEASRGRSCHKCRPPRADRPCRRP